MCEPFISKSDKEDETIYEFACRRLGKYMADNVLDPFTSGVFGSDSRKISVRSAFKILRDMEQEHGSLFKAIRAKLKNAPKKKQGKLSSFRDGMEELIIGLRKKLEGKVSFKTGVKVEKVSECENGCEIYFADSSAKYDIVVTAAQQNQPAKFYSQLLVNSPKK